MKRKYKKLYYDYETRSSIDLKVRGRKNYMDSPDFEPIIMAYAFDDEPTQVLEFPSWSRIQGILLQAEKHIAHNARFELGVNRATGNIDASSATFKDILRRTTDTAIKCKYYGIPESLEKAGKWLGLPIQKLTVGKKGISLFTVPIPEKVKERLGITQTFWGPKDKPEDWAQFLEYAKVDVDVCRLVDKTLPDLPEAIWNEWHVDYMINQNGISIDRQLCEKAVIDLENEANEAKNELLVLTDLENPNSGAQMKQWLKNEYNLDVTSLSKETIPQIIKSSKDERLARVLNLYSLLARTSNKKFSKFIDLMDSNDKLYDILNYYGAHTGRWSSWGVQLHNMKRIEIADYEKLRELAKSGLLPAMYDNLSDIYPSLIRTAIIAPKGKHLIIGDFSQIEARVLQWGAKAWDAIEVFRSGKDIYAYAAANMYNKRYEDIDKKSPERRMGKIATLGLGYGGGVVALRLGEDELSVEEKQLIVQKWRKSNPQVVKYWNNLEAAFIKSYITKSPVELSIGKSDRLIFDYELISNIPFISIELPSKRKLYFPRVRHDGKQYVSLLKSEDHSAEFEQSIYGGFLAENVTQAIARDCLSDVVMRCYEKGYKIAFHVHDEVILEVDETVPVQELKEVMTTEGYEDLPLDISPVEGIYYDK